MRRGTTADAAARRLGMEAVVAVLLRVLAPDAGADDRRRAFAAETVEAQAAL